MFSYSKHLRNKLVDRSNEFPGMAKAVADIASRSYEGDFMTNGSNKSKSSSIHDSGRSPLLVNFALFPYDKCECDQTDGCQCPKLFRKI